MVQLGASALDRMMARHVICNNIVHMRPAITNIHHGEMTSGELKESML